MPRQLSINITLIISVLLFVLSLNYICYCTRLGCIDSAEVFGTGWFGAIIEIGNIVNWLTEKMSKHHAFIDGHTGASITWLANLLLFVSWIGLLRWPKGSLVTSFIALLVSLSFLLFSHVLFNDIGHYSKIVAYREGYWLWVASMVAVVAGNIVIKFIPHTPKATNKKSARPFIPE